MGPSPAHKGIGFGFENLSSADAFRRELLSCGFFGAIGHTLALRTLVSYRDTSAGAEIECVAGGRALRGQPRPDLSPWVFRPPIV